MVRIYNVSGRLAATAEQFHVTYADIVADNFWAWRNLGNRFSPPPMTYRWVRGVV